MVPTLLTETTNSLLNSDVMEFIVDGMTQVITLATSSSLSIFITIAVSGSIVGLALGLVSRVKNI